MGCGTVASKICSSSLALQALPNKGKAVDVKWVGRELDVRYVLEGSVRKAATAFALPGS